MKNNPNLSFDKFIELEIKGNTRFLFDTSFLLNSKSPLEILCAKYWKKIEEKIRKNRPIFIVPCAVRNEILKIKKGNKYDDSIRNRASNVFKFLAKMQGSITYVGKESDVFADNVFLSGIHEARKKFNLVIFTNDNKLAIDILSINDTQSCVYPTSIYIAKANKEENDILIIKEKSGLKKKTPPKRSEKRPVLNYVEACKYKAENISSGIKLESKDKVKTPSNKSYTLSNSISKGGEGEVFEVVEDKNIVVKIYFPQKRTKKRLDKIKLMCSKGFSLKGVAFPIDLLYSKENKFVGFSMAKIEGVSVSRILSKEKLKSVRPSWNRLHLTNLAHLVVSKICEIHSLGIVIGDVNLQNIFISNDDSVSIVDADSFQIDNFPCPVGQEPFRAPEISSGKNFDEFLRNYENDDYAVSVLVFIILMIGKPPFITTDGKSDRTKFVYTEDKSSIPAGPSRFIWSYFSKELKEIFESTFKGTSPKGRATIFELERALSKYCNIISSKNDSNDNLLFPLSFKSFNGKYEKVNCVQCNTSFKRSEFDASKHKTPICGDCLAVNFILRKQSPKTQQNDKFKKIKKQLEELKRKEEEKRKLELEREAQEKSRLEALKRQEEYKRMRQEEREKIAREKAIDEFGEKYGCIILIVVFLIIKCLFW